MGKSFLCFYSCSPSSLSALISCTSASFPTPKPLKIFPHHSSFPPCCPFLCCLISGQAGSSIWGHRLSVEASPFISSSRCCGSERPQNQLCALKAGWLSAGRERRGGRGSRRGLSCQLEKWNFIWMNRWTVQQEWGRIESGVTNSGINDKKQPDRINGGSREGGVCFCARHHQVKKESLFHLRVKRSHVLVKCD